MSRLILDAPETIAPGHGRYFLACSGTPHAWIPNNLRFAAVPCAPRWETLPETKVRASQGYGRYFTRIQPAVSTDRCPCGSMQRVVHRLEVDAYSNACRQEGKTRHTCENTCQISESKKCRCACGGRRHGEALREFWL